LRAAEYGPVLAFLFVVAAVVAVVVTAVRRFPSLPWLALAVGGVVVGALVTHAVLEFACTRLENPSEDWLEGCEAYPDNLPLVGVAASVTGAAAALISRRGWLLALGLGVGLAIGLVPWIVYGDPGGNWDGLVY
jgi:hypothetical protein